MSTPDQFAKKAAGFGPALEANTTKAVNGAALATKLSVLAAARSRGWNLKPWMIHYKMLRVDGGPAALLKARGGKPFMFEKGAKGHEIGSGVSKVNRRTGRRYQTRSKRILAGPNLAHPVAGPVQHPGFAGRPFWDRGVQSARPAVEQIMAVAVKGTLAQMFRG